jgi:hypothetical protein
MTFMLRDRPDGQIEIVVNRPQVIGVFTDRDYAQKFFVFLQDEDAFGQVEDAPAGFATASADVKEAELGDIAEVAAMDQRLPAFLRPVAPPPSPKPRQDRLDAIQLPAVVEPPKRTALVAVEQPRHLTEEQLAQAFDRITMGEKLAVVAPDFGLTLNQLRGMWANHKRYLQKHLAEGGQIACALCTEPFTPSISSPDKCARCSHE